MKAKAEALLEQDGDLEALAAIEQAEHAIADEARRRIRVPTTTTVVTSTPRALRRPRHRPGTRALGRLAAN